MSQSSDEPTRRDFLTIATGAFAATGAAVCAWPVIDQMNPDASVRALSSIEVDLSPIGVGQDITVKWRGKPVFIRHRTQKEIDDVQKTPLSDLKDPAKDSDRVKKPQWLVLVGICTHLGCVPIVQGEGWFCPCHGSHYDGSGRILRGPAPLNLVVPPYTFLSETRIKIG